MSEPTVAPAGRTGWPLILGVLLLRTVLLFAGTAVLTPLLGGYHRALIWSNVTIVVVDVISILVIGRLLHRRGETLRGLIGARFRDTGWALLCFVIVVAGFLVATFIGNLVAYRGPPLDFVVFAPPLWLGVWSLLVMPVTIAFAEELLYRGWAQRELTARTSRGLGVLIMAVFFALQHAALTRLDVEAQLSRFVAMFLVGLLFGVLYLWRRRLWPLIVAHWLLNVVGLGLPVLLTAL